jgi:hypothetical protein
MWGRICRHADSAPAKPWFFACHVTASEVIAGKTLLSKAKLLDDPHLKASTWKTLNELIEILDKRAQTVQQAVNEQTAIANSETDPTEKVVADR